MTVAGAFGFAMGYVVGLQIDVSATKNPRGMAKKPITKNIFR